MASHIEKLEQLNDELMTRHDLVKKKFEIEMPNSDPYMVTDERGTFILLDSLTCIVNAQAALVYVHVHRGDVHVHGGEKAPA